MTSIASSRPREPPRRRARPAPCRSDQRRAQPSGQTSRRWGTAITRPDGAVTLDTDPWPDR
jgi:hypothetical protein